MVHEERIDRYFKSKLMERDLQIKYLNRMKNVRLNTTIPLKQREQILERITSEYESKQEQFERTAPKVDPSSPPRVKEVTFPSGPSIWEAAWSGDLNALKVLVEKEKVNINSRYLSGQTPLIFAARSAKLNTLAYLVEKGADINAQDVNGRSALMFAARNGTLNIVHFLVSKGANLTATDIFGETPRSHICIDYSGSNKKTREKEILNLLRDKI